MFASDWGSTAISYKSRSIYIQYITTNTQIGAEQNQMISCPLVVDAHNYCVNFNQKYIIKKKDSEMQTGQKINTLSSKWYSHNSRGFIDYDGMPYCHNIVAIKHQWVLWIRRKISVQKKLNLSTFQSPQWTASRAITQIVKNLIFAMQQ